MLAVMELARRAASNSYPVLLTGETGVGKGVVAAFIHRSSARGARAQLVVNCATIQPSTAESQLFGHRRGAFTDAKDDRPGLLLVADRSSLVLDDIGELHTSVQPKLLRVLDSGMLLPVGDRCERPFDARLLATTNVDLEAAVRAGQFRADLLYRLSTIEIRIPSLRDRVVDVLPLAHRFVRAECRALGRQPVTLASETESALLRYTWPGNVRELLNAIRSALVLCDGPVLLATHLPGRVSQAGWGHAGSTVATSNSSEEPPLHLRQLRTRAVEAALRAASGNRTRAAGLLGVNRVTLFRWLRGGQTSAGVPEALRRESRSDTSR